MQVALKEAAASSKAFFWADEPSALSVPSKQSADADALPVPSAAAALRSVNTVVALPDGRLAGHSTDGDGFVADVTEVVVTGLDPAATRLVVEWWTPDGGRHRIERE